MPPTSSQRAGKPFAPGTRVRVRFGVRTFPATVVEDRGLIGAGGRRLVRVRVRLDPTDQPREFELPAEELHLRPQSGSHRTARHR